MDAGGAKRWIEARAGPRSIDPSESESTRWMGGRLARSRASWSGEATKVGGQGTNLVTGGGGTAAEEGGLGKGRGPARRGAVASLATTFLGAYSSSTCSSSLDSSSFSTIGCHDSSVLDLALGSRTASSDSSGGKRSIGSAAGIVEEGLGFRAGEEGSGLTGRNFSLDASNPLLAALTNDARGFGAEEVEDASEGKVAGERVGRPTGGGAKSSSPPRRSIGTAFVG